MPSWMFIVMSVLLLLAFQAVLFSAVPLYPVLGLDSAPVGTGVRIVINLAMSWGMFVRICMKWFYFCHKLLMFQIMFLGGVSPQNLNPF